MFVPKAQAFFHPPPLPLHDIRYNCIVCIVSLYSEQFDFTTYLKKMFTVVLKYFKNNNNRVKQTLKLKINKIHEKRKHIIITRKRFNKHAKMQPAVFYWDLLRLFGIRTHERSDKGGKK